MAPKEQAGRMFSSQQSGHDATMFPSVPPAGTTGGLVRERVSTASLASPSSAATHATEFTMGMIAIYGALLLALTLLRPIKTAHFAAALPSGNPNAVVWADVQTGRYYCPGAALFGEGKGKYLTQTAAQSEEFRPAPDRPCE